MADGIDMRLKSPFTAIVAGPSGCGKTELVLNFIRNRDTVCTDPPVQVIYCYGVWQEKFEEFSDIVTFREGLVDVTTDIERDGCARWVIIDDLMEEVSGKESLNNLFTKYSHHLNVSCVFMSQNLFNKGKLRTVTLNTKYMFIFKNPRDKQVIENFAKQAFPGKVPAVRDAYADATEEPHSYLMIDMAQTTPERVRLVGNYMRHGKPLIAYDVTGV